MSLVPLVALIFFSVSGGAYGIEPLFSTSGPGMGILLILITPLIYSVPHALVCAELGTAIPVEGGYYHWVKRGLGRFWAFQQGVLQWVCSFVDMALYPVMFTSYLSSLISAVAPGKHVLFELAGLQIDLNWVICVGVILIFTLLNLMGAGWVGDSSVAFAIICLTPMLILTAIGGYHLLTDGINPVSSMTAEQGQSTWNAFGSGLFIVMWNYSGWDSVSTVAGEMENPKKHLPKALVWSVLLIIVGYLLPSIAALAVGADGEAGWTKWEDGSFSDIAGELAGPWLQYTVTIGGLFASVAMFSALLASYSRLPSSLSRDGYLPNWVSKESKRYRMPMASIIGSSVIYALFCFSSFQSLVIYDVFLTNLGILLEVAALIALRIREPRLERPYRIPGGWWSIGAITACLTAVSVWAAVEQYREEGTKAVVYCLIVVGISLLLYPLLSRRKAAREAAAVERHAAQQAAGVRAYGLSEWQPDSPHTDKAATGTGPDSVEA
ncbi:APC family permease [Kitasatospora cheerisanensis]|uniref:Putative amino acid transporter n=1 Tax=Kitasatospora cheerisanensis KCTC 2395 TaxID=1348663 RepID=A0A066ZCP5_9ACTN|nr:APC family permease [Kitasatospora cheerisanensis]KDN88086.1 putative amino acid transporter [Kitasatospora cheerisanensis KCTC 2395]